MRNPRQLPALVLLAAFAAGGTLAPALHRAGHGLTYHHHAEAAAAQTDHVHTGAAAFTIPLRGIPGEHPTCVLCLPRLLSVQPPATVPGPAFREQTLRSVTPKAPPPAPALHRAIRGPPARLA